MITVTTEWVAGVVKITIPPHDKPVVVTVPQDVAKQVTIVEVD